LFPSVERFTHAFGQTVWPDVQVVHRPLAQAAPETHCVLLVQLVAQAVAPHTYLPQLWTVAVGQLPAPSQLAASVWDPLAQLADRQLVLGNTHDAEVPLQVPAQVPLPLQAACPARGVPETLEQVPAVWPLLVSLQA
jgi:hypothetical protein